MLALTSSTPGMSHICPALAVRTPQFNTCLPFKFVEQRLQYLIYREKYIQYYYLTPVGIKLPPGSPRPPPRRSPRGTC